MNTDSMFSTSDAIGPFRRALFGLSCDTIKNQLAQLPAAGTLLGLANAINDPVLCGNNTGNPILGDLGLPVPVPLPKKGDSKTPKAPSQGQTTPGGSTTPQKTPQTPTVPGTPTVPSAPTPTVPNAAPPTGASVTPPQPGGGGGGLPILGGGH
jgi:hypothetical protein